MTSSLNPPTIRFYYIFPGIPPIRLTLNIAFHQAWHKVHSPLETKYSRASIKDSRQNSKDIEVILGPLLFIAAYKYRLEQPCPHSRSLWVLGPVSREAPDFVYLMKLLTKETFLILFLLSPELMCDPAFVYPSCKRKPKPNGSDVWEPYNMG